MFRHNDDDLFLPLDGAWRFSLADGPERVVHVPGAWEAETDDYLTEGPAVYTREVELDPEWAGCRVWLEVEAASFVVEVFANGSPAGAHRGMWSPFQIELTDHLRAGANELRLEVWKPGKRYPMREALAGFLPDVCTTFGGLWQSVRLRGARPNVVGLQDVLWSVAQDGSVKVSAAIAGDVPPDTRVELTVGRTRVVASLNAGAASFDILAPRALRRRFQAQAPQRTAATVKLYDRDSRLLASLSRRLGRRWFAAQGDGLSLNKAPAHLRGVLDWGWNPRVVAPHLDDVASQFAKARELGFNLWKCCLYVPDEAFLEAADAAGMWVWLEMPLWLPSVTPTLEGLALNEYRSVFERLHHHPCIAVVTLGCELNRATSAAFLRELDALARRYFPGVLIGDNSGSSEAYGGVRADLGDFIDYHFYADPHFFGPLIQHFGRAYRRPRPWLYGEFCDADTLRDFEPAQSSWWLNASTPLDRDDYLAQRDHASRFTAAGIVDQGKALTAIGRRQATAVRKHILERVRRERATGGYVVTGWRDTPITTSGMVDDDLALKFEPDRWRRFNADRILCLDRDRRRLWSGGDQPSPREPYVFWSREATELHLIVANGGTALPVGRLTWELRDDGGQVIDLGALTAQPVPAGESRETAILDLNLPATTVSRALTLSVVWSDRDNTEPEFTNVWRLLILPRPTLPSVVAITGLTAHRSALKALWPATAFVELIGAPASAPLLTDACTPEVGAAIAAGRQAFVWLSQPHPTMTDARPFWREAIHQVDHEHLGLPICDHVDLTAHGVASGLCLVPDSDAMARTFAQPDVTIAALRWRRFDARRFDWRDYWLDLAIGLGRCAVTTLRLAGGEGEQPAQLTSNPLGIWLLARGLSSAS